MTLGTSVLDQASIDSHAEALRTWGESLTADSDLLFYGCSIGQSEAGAALLSRIAMLTEADVAASINATGDPGLGGDWILERQTGRIESAGRLSTEGYQFLLAPALSGISAVADTGTPKDDLVASANVPLTQLSGFRLERCETKGVEPAKGCLPDYRFLADIDLAYPQAGRVQGERVAYQDLNLAPDRRYTYRVAAYGPKRHLGEWSGEVTHAWGVPPRSPAALKAEAGDRQVGLNWTPVDRLKDGAPLRDLAGYEIYRRVKEGEYSRLTPKPLGETSYQDVAAKNDVLILMLSGRCGAWDRMCWQAGTRPRPRRGLTT